MITALCLSYGAERGMRVERNVTVPCDAMPCDAASQDRKDMLAYKDRDKKPNKRLGLDPFIARWISWLTPEVGSGSTVTAIQHYRPDSPLTIPYQPVQLYNSDIGPTSTSLPDDDHQSRQVGLRSIFRETDHHVFLYWTPLQCKNYSVQY